MKRTFVLLGVAALVAAPALVAGTIDGRSLEPEYAVQVEASEAEGAPEHARAKEAITGFLGLTDQQVADWDALWQARAAAIDPLREQLESTEEQLRELLQGESPDPAAVGTLVIAGKTLRDGIVAAHRDYVEGFEALLTGEQKARLGAVRRAARLAPLVPAFAAYGLLPPQP